MTEREAGDSLAKESKSDKPAPDVKIKQKIELHNAD
jgi:hypothetical protein